MSRNWWGRVLALGAGIALLSTTAVAEPLKVGFVYVGPIGDHGWSYQHDQGRLALEAALGDQVETTYVESVPEGADAEREAGEADTDQHRTRHDHLPAGKAPPEGTFHGMNPPLDRADVAECLHPRGHEDAGDHASPDHGHDQQHGPADAAGGLLGLAEHRQQHHDADECQGDRDHCRRQWKVD